MAPKALKVPTIVPRRDGSACWPMSTMLAMTPPTSPTPMSTAHRYIPGPSGSSTSSVEE